MTRTFEEAFAEAKKHLNKITVCYEYVNCYEFQDDSQMMEGELPCVGVWKDSEQGIMNERVFLRQMIFGIIPTEPISTIRLDWEKEE